MNLLIKRVMTIGEQYYTQIDMVMVRATVIFILLGLSGYIYYYRMELQKRRKKDQNTLENDEYSESTSLIGANDLQSEQNQDIILIINQSKSQPKSQSKSQSTEQYNYGDQLDLLKKNNKNIERCQINPICEFLWINDPNVIKGPIYCPMCDKYEQSNYSFNSVGSELIDQLIKCVYCNLQMKEHFVTSCGCTYHDDCLQKHISLSQGKPSIKCARCTKPIHKGLAKYGNLKEEQKNQLFDNQLAIIKQQNKCQSGYFKCQKCGELYNQDECGCKL